jgi:hypothetical protein
VTVKELRNILISLTDVHDNREVYVHNDSERVKIVSFMMMEEGRITFKGESQ